MCHLIIFMSIIITCHHVPLICNFWSLQSAAGSPGVVPSTRFSIKFTLLKSNWLEIPNSAGCHFWIMMFTRVSILERKFYPDRNVKFEEKIKSSFRINFLPLYTLPSQVPLSLQFVDRGEFVLLLTFIKDINWCNIVANRAEFVQEKLEENIARIAKLPLKWAKKGCCRNCPYVKYLFKCLHCRHVWSVCTVKLWCLQWWVGDMGKSGWWVGQMVGGWVTGLVWKAPKSNTLTQPAQSVRQGRYWAARAGKNYTVCDILFPSCPLNFMKQTICLTTLWIFYNDDFA